MAQIPYPKTVRVTCHSKAWGEQIINVWHVLTPELDGEPQIPELTNIALCFNGFYATNSGSGQDNIASIRPSSASLVRVTAQSLHSVPYKPPLEYAAGAPGTGSAGLPLDLAIVASLRTDVGTRSGRGRVFLGPLDRQVCLESSTDSVAPQVTAVAQGRVLLAVQDLDAELAKVPGYPCMLAVLSKKDGISRPVQRVVVDANFDVIRGRSDTLDYHAVKVGEIERL